MNWVSEYIILAYGNCSREISWVLLPIIDYIAGKYDINLSDEYENCIINFTAGSSRGHRAIFRSHKVSSIPPLNSEMQKRVA